MLKIRVFQDGKAPTEVQVTTWTNDGKLTPFTNGSLEDVKGGMVLPIIKIQGGVYFVQKNFGTSLAASRLLVIRDATGQQSSSEFELGDDQSSFVLHDLLLGLHRAVFYYYSKYKHKHHPDHFQHF